MTNFLQRHALSGQVVAFERPSHYWLRRAQRHRKRGEHHQAAALLRRAVALEPASGELRLEYAQSLRDMSCYEASTREALGALALEPAGFLPYGIIGRNMLSLGREQEALDAFSQYVQNAPSPRDATPLWEDADESFYLEDLAEEPRRGKARYEASLHLASLRLARGDAEGARRKLTRASHLGARGSRFLTLLAMLSLACGRPQEALHHALLAVKLNPRQVVALCTLADVRMRRGERGLAAAALLAAAFHCRYPHEEQLFCLTASALKLPQPMLAMLRLGKRRSPERVPTLYNLAVALLGQGQTLEAMAHLQRCRELDPEDVTVLFMTQTVTDWLQDGPDGKEPPLRARELPFYPMLPARAERRLLQTLAQALEQGLPAFVDALAGDGLLYRQYLYALTSPISNLGHTLPAVGGALARLAPAQAERLLRDVLLQNAQDDQVKGLALSMLVSGEATPPYALWQNGRIVQVDPKAKPAWAASVFQRLALRRIRAAQRLTGDARLPGHALELLRRMDHRARYAFVADVGHSWQSALIAHFCLTHGLPWAAAVPIPQTPHTRQRARHAFERLCALMPIQRRT